MTDRYAPLPATEDREVESELAAVQRQIAVLEAASGQRVERLPGGDGGPNTPTSSASASDRANASELARLQHTLTPRSLERDDDVLASPALAALLARHEAALDENAKLRQAFSSAKAAVANDERLLRVLSTADGSLSVRPGNKGDATTEDCCRRPPAPAPRALRRTAATKGLFGRIWFTHDGRTLAHGGNTDPELSLWDVATGTRQLGVKRSKPVRSSALSPDGRLVAVAAMDGLALYRFAAARADGDSAQQSCELVWEAGAGAAFSGVAFSRDGALVASAQSASGAVEVRDVASNRIVAKAQFEGFPSGNWDGSPSGLDFSPALLAVGGRGDVCGTQLRLYAIRGGDFAELRTLQLGGRSHNLRFDRSGCRLAVGLQSGTCDTLIFAAGEDGEWSAPPLRLPSPGGRGNHACDTAFSHDGRLLCAGYHRQSQTHGTNNRMQALWDLEAGTLVRDIRGCGFHACAFSPADDLLALGGHEGGPVHIRELLPQGCIGSYAMPDGGGGGGSDDVAPPLSAACSSAEVAVLARGTRLAAFDRCDGGKVLWQLDLGEDPILTHHYPLALQPRGTQLAVCVAGKQRSLSLRCLRTGAEQRRILLEGNAIRGGVRYSPDGRLVLVGGQQATVFVAETGEPRYTHQFETAKEGNLILGSVDPKNRFLVAASADPNASFVAELENGEIISAVPDMTHGQSFDDAGERLAYCIKSKFKVVAVDGWRETLSFTIPGFSWGFLHFSPGSGEYLLVTQTDLTEWRIVRTEDGEQPAWSECLRAMMLPAANAPARNARSDHLQSVSWVRSQTTVADGPLVLQMVVDHQLHLVNVSAFARSFQEDGNFSLAQLNGLSDIAPDAIGTFLKSWPYTTNFRDPGTLDTVLHHCARTGKPEAASAWINTDACFFTPLKNSAGITAVGEAVVEQQSDTARELLCRLDPKLVLARTDSVTADLVAIGEKWPRQLVEFVQLLESPEGYSLFRTVRRLDVLRQQLEDIDVRASTDGSGTVPWKLYEGQDATIKCVSELQVLALRGFAGQAQGGELPPYTRLFNACEKESESQLSLLLGTKLMIATTNFKWDTYVKGRVWGRLCKYLFHFMLAGAALVVSTQAIEQQAEFRTAGGWTGGKLSFNSYRQAMVADVLQVALLTTNTLVARFEAQQIHLAADKEGGVLGYFYTKGGSSAGGDWKVQYWNLCDLLGILSLYIASIGHFVGARFALQQVGALGVLLNSFSLMQLLTPFPLTGPLIKTVIEIMHDIRGYLIITLIVLLGFSMSFAISMPENEAFHDGPAGPLIGLLTSYEAIVGSFHMSDYTNNIARAAFLFFLFIVVIVMLNLLIAIMSDSYEKVKDGEVVEARKLTAQTIIDEEAMMSKDERENPDYFPEFLEALQAIEPPEVVWSGVSGQISKVEKHVLRAQDILEKKLDDKVNHLAEQMAKQMEAMAEIKIMLERSLATSGPV